MSAEAQAVWITAAIDALEDIQPGEIAAISAELRRGVTRPAQIVPEIARLVAERRKRSHGRQEGGGGVSLWSIQREARERLLGARDQVEIEAAQTWERSAMIAFQVRPIAKPLTRAELDNLPDNLVKMGLKAGFLYRRDGKLHERAPLA